MYVRLQKYACTGNNLHTGGRQMYHYFLDVSVFIVLNIQINLLKIIHCYNLHK